MKVFMKKNRVQKILIAIITVILLNFSIPTPVQADLGGDLFQPLFALITVIVDGGQHLLEWTMLGETDNFMKDIGDPNIPNDSGVTVNVDGSKIDAKFGGLDKVNIPVIKYSPEEIFSNKVPALNANFINPESTGISSSEDRNIAAQLQPTISSWYSGLRIISVVALLSVLIYLGIRILLTSVAADKAKYKKMLFDWLVAMILVFILHYIMAFIMTMTNYAIDMLGGGDDIAGSIHVVVTGGDQDYEFSTNLIGYVRFMIQHNDFMEKVAYLALYIMLLVFTFKFTWTYLKRVVSLAFLTVLAPFVAFTYPIDKVSDGSAQAFNMWLKEYTFNALIQPLHLLIYKILLGSAADLATQNPLYAVVCFGFMVGAEKMLKQMFGFNKAGQSGGGIASVAGAAGITAMATSMLKGESKKVLSATGGSGGNGKIRTSKTPQRTGRDTDANHGFNAFDTKDAKGIEAPSSEGTQSQYDNKNPQTDTRIQERDSNNRDTSQEQGNTSNESQERQNTNDNSDQNSSIDKNRLYDDDKPEYGNNNDASYTNEEPSINVDGSPIADESRAAIERLRDPQRIPEPEQESDNTQSTSNNTQSTSNNTQSTSNNPTKENEPQGFFGKEGILGQGFKNVGAAGAKVLSSANDGRKKIIKGVKGLGHAETYANAARRVGNAARRAGDGIKAMPHNANIALGKSYTAAKGTIRKYAPVAGAAAYSVARGVAKAAPKVALGGAAALVVGAATATSGDPEKTLGAAAAAFTGGATLGGRAFEGTVGRVAQARSVRTALDNARYGSVQDAQNARADNEFLKSEEFDQFYRREIKTTDELKNMTKKETKEAFKSYRQAGITDNNTIKKALRLEQEKDGEGNKMFSREEVQNIVQTSSMIDSKAYVDDKVKAKEKNRISGLLGNIKDKEQKEQVVDKIFTGYEKYRNL